MAEQYRYGRFKLEVYVGSNNYIVSVYDLSNLNWPLVWATSVVTEDRVKKFIRMFNSGKLTRILEERGMVF